MAQAIKCDRCGKFFEPKNSHDIVKEGAINGRKIINIKISTVGMYDVLDICEQCSDEFREWFGMEKTCLK